MKYFTYAIERATRNDTEDDYHREDLSSIHDNHKDLETYEDVEKYVKNKIMKWKNHCIDSGCINNDEQHKFGSMKIDEIVELSILEVEETHYIDIQNLLLKKNGE